MMLWFPVEGTAEPYDGVCWNCQGTRLTITPDPEMRGMTDTILCLDCGEVQVGDDDIPFPY